MYRSDFVTSYIDERINEAHQFADNRRLAQEVRGNQSAHTVNPLRWLSSAINRIANLGQGLIARLKNASPTVFFLLIRRNNYREE